MNKEIITVWNVIACVFECLFLSVSLSLLRNSALLANENVNKYFTIYTMYTYISRHRACETRMYVSKPLLIHGV